MVVRHHLYRADDVIIIGPNKQWVRTRFSCLYGSEPAQVKRIDLTEPKFVSGPKPQAPDLRWLPPEFIATLPAA